MKPRFTYANVTATLALVLALGTGGAYAAGQLAPKSVGAKQLRPGAVTAQKLRKHAVTENKIHAGAVSQGKIVAGAVVTAKLADEVVTSSKLANGAIGPDKIPDGSITGQKVQAGTLGRVPSAETAQTADFAASSNPEAFAKVNAEGTTFPAYSKGIDTSDVKQGPEPGIYCISIPGFVPRGAQATPEYDANNSVSVFVRLGGTASCSYPLVEVQTYNAGGRVKEPFYFVAYR